MNNVASLILSILAILIIIIFIGSMYALFYAIFLFIFSAGDPEKIKKAWNSIRYMILGIIFTLVVLFFFPIVLQKAKIPGYNYYTPNNIFTRVSKISGGFINLGKQAISSYEENKSIGGGILLPSSLNQETNPSSAKQPNTFEQYKDLEL